MNKPLLGSLVAATLLLGNASAATMFERFVSMEKEMKKLQKELAELKAAKGPASRGGADEDEGDDEADEKEGYSEDEADDDEDGINVNEAIEELQESVEELTKATSGNHLKLGVDFRTSFDDVNYKMADGSNAENDGIFTNRLWINMDWAANENISFTGQLAYNKQYGQRFGASNTANGSLEGFDWITNENANDDTLRVRSAYFFYRDDSFLGSDIPWTFSLGRRPSTNGHLINLRDDDPAASPSGHAINVEFDGVSSKFGLEKLTGVTGMYVKLCGGRGASNASPRFNNTPYSSTASDNANIDMAGLIFVPYNNGQYSVGSMFYRAKNLIDLNNPSNQTGGFRTVGSLDSASAYAMVNGIGNEWSDYLDDSTFFISGAMSKTDPDAGQSMLGSTQSETGYSYWAGLNMPSLVSEEGRWGVEFNHGSKFWRSITYGEDTMIGSKVAARGDAYEVYFTEPLLDDIFTLQVRYTYIDYDYAGSNGFFGGTANGAIGTGTPFEISGAMGNPGSYVDKAQNIRVYLRYRY